MPTADAERRAIQTNAHRAPAMLIYLAAVPENHFAGVVADGYDAASHGMYEPHVLGPTVDFLAALAGSGQALEFAIGTGRVAIPLSQRGVDVSGIELSSDMVVKLREKPECESIATMIGDMATTRVAGTFGLVYLVFNTIANLITQAEQVACFENAAAHLEPGGHFVIEVWVPRLQQMVPGQRLQTFAATPDHLGVDEIDIATQTGVSRHYYLQGTRTTQFHMPYRYVWAAELDLMARIAGMELAERWGGWNREPFTSDSEQHISVWKKPPA